jgi:hypothetical protein
MDEHGSFRVRLVPDMRSLCMMTARLNGLGQTDVNRQSNKVDPVLHHHDNGERRYSSTHS